MTEAASSPRRRSRKYDSSPLAAERRRDAVDAWTGGHAGIDPMLLEILRSEVEGHLARSTMRGSTQRATPRRCREAAAARGAHDDGAISMADVPVITGVIGPLEALHQAPARHRRERRARAA